MCALLKNPNEARFKLCNDVATTAASQVCVCLCVVDLLFVRQLFFELLYHIRTRELVIIMAQAKHMNNKLKLEHELEL